MDVLVLNRSYLPLGRINWEAAFTMVFTGRAEIVEEYADKVVRSASEIFRMPSIIRFLTRASCIFKRRNVKFNRKNVYLRDKGTCQYCRTKVPMSEFTYDHVRPRSQGGKTKWENIVVACLPCNHKKADRTPEQARMRLMAKPVRPTTLPGGEGRQFRWSEPVPESWKDYLGSVKYWTEGIDG
jgi:5-methylcytosine-specific restriction endonuclease McrA